MSVDATEVDALSSFQAEDESTITSMYSEEEEEISYIDSCSSSAAASDDDTFESSYREYPRLNSEFLSWNVADALKGTTVHDLDSSKYQERYESIEQWKSYQRPLILEEFRATISAAYDTKDYKVIENCIDIDNILSNICNSNDDRETVKFSIDTSNCNISARNYDHTVAILRIKNETSVKKKSMTIFVRLKAELVKRGNGGRTFSGQQNKQWILWGIIDHGLGSKLAASTLLNRNAFVELLLLKTMITPTERFLNKLDSFSKNCAPSFIDDILQGNVLYGPPIK
jgi:hypothetical protein